VSIFPDYTKLLDEAYRQHLALKVVFNKAKADGKEIIGVTVEVGTKVGDVIAIVPVEETDDDEETAELQAQVLATSDCEGLSEDGEIVQYCDAICVLVQPGEIETAEEFAATYGEDEEGPGKTENANLCGCGANKMMCEKNQNVFGTHINE